MLFGITALEPAHKVMLQLCYMKKLLKYSNRKVTSILLNFIFTTQVLSQNLFPDYTKSLSYSTVVLYIGIMKVWGFWPKIITPKPA